MSEQNEDVAAIKTEDYNYDDIEELTKPGRQFVQWEKFGSGFVPSGTTVAAIPPGAYELAHNNSVGFYFSKTDLVVDNLVQLPDSRSDEVIAEIQKFWTLKGKFKEMGFTYKRGLLLWGPPGGGKTSTVGMVVKNIIKMGGIAIMFSGRPSIISGLLKNLRQVEPSRPVVLVMEDIDGLPYEEELLAMLDGENSIDNIVYLGTTNYPEKLSGRVVNRPSRFDKVIRIGMPKDDARKAYLESRKLGFTPEMMNKWVSLTSGFSIAHIKEMLISVFGFGETLEETVKRMKHMAVPPNSSDASDDPKWQDSEEAESKDDDDDEENE